MSVTIDTILHPGHDAAERLKQNASQLALLGRLIASHEQLHAALDDVTLVTLDTMRNTLLINIRRASRNQILADDYREQLRPIQEEILQRTARIAHRAGMSWSDAEDARLQRLSRAGETIECIASTLGRSTVSISKRATGFGIAFGDDGRAATGGAL